MLRRPHVVCLVVIATAGCDGVLHEKTGGEADASVLGQIQAPPCDVQVAAPSDGHHNPGDDCLGCHHQGGADGAPPFTFAGTLFDSPGGITPVAGASFHLIDALGMDAVVQTSANGNFYATDLLTFPVVAFATLCGSEQQMLAPIAELDGSCNRSGCHTTGFRLH